MLLLINHLVPVIPNRFHVPSGLTRALEPLGLRQEDPGCNSSLSTKNLPSVLEVFVRKPDDQTGRLAVGKVGLHEPLNVAVAARVLLNRVGEPRRPDRVDEDAMRLALNGECLRQPNDCQLRSCVQRGVLHAEHGVGRDHDDPAVLLLLHVRPGSMGEVVGALDMDREHLAQPGQRSLLEGSKFKGSGVVDDDVNAPELVDGLLYHGLSVGRVCDAADVGDCLAAGFDDIVDGRLRGRGFGAVDDYGCAEATEEKSVLAA